MDYKDFGFEEPKKLDISSLPKKYRENWGCILFIKSDFMVRYATRMANIKIYGDEARQGVDRENAKAWCDAFDDAARCWGAVNPLSEFWPFSDYAWPVGADIAIDSRERIGACNILRKENGVELDSRGIDITQ